MHIDQRIDCTEVSVCVCVCVCACVCVCVCVACLFLCWSVVIVPRLKKPVYTLASCSVCGEYFPYGHPITVVRFIIDAIDSDMLARDS
jgi:hypothetical protein